MTAYLFVEGAADNSIPWVVVVLKELTSGSKLVCFGKLGAIKISFYLKQKEFHP
ncbi:MAG: hypothetical protein IPJ13_11005 [Saprospiraceae bacterium]|nr:hypothetical protein [Saprospiraceae bacterium]